MRSGLLPLLLLAAVACDSTDPGTGGSTGGLALVTTTAGIQPDTDGYAIMVDGARHGTIRPNDSLTVEDIEAGSHAVELSGIEFNCATLGQFTRTISVAADAESTVEYSVACDAHSRSRIAFVRDASSSEELSVMDADGSNVASLRDSLGAVHQGGMLLPSINWSGDGTRVAFTRADSGLYATTADGAGELQLAPSGILPIWSDDGLKIAFLVADSAPQLCCWSIFVAESDGSAVTRITSDVTVVHYDFAANGSLLVYEDDPATTRNLIVVRPDGTGRRVISPPAGVCCPQLPSLSPDGTKVAYYAYPEDQGDDGPGYEIYVSPTDQSGVATDVSNNPGDDWWPVWSPDGTRIAFVSSDSEAPFAPGSLRAVDADGRHQITLTPTDAAGEPAWSPDGSRIAYTGYTGTHGRVFVANADGSGRMDVTPNEQASRPVWTGR